ncbi:MAG: hypothetical protein GYB36_00950 [Alphaproteobacteria bacterium]|nr:hypothetical protein [Alphaproteobacteria bacterium]
MSKTIVLVGCGNIGSRTLQSLLGIDSANLQSLTIWCFDPNPKSLELAQTRAAEVSTAADANGHKVEFVNRLHDLPTHADLAIISTTSSHRWSATNELLAHTSVERLILEKFLFTEAEHYGLAAELFAKTGTSCWVNCPRPAWPGYLNLATRIKGRGPVQARVAGSNWAMASNVIHFLAAFSAITGERFTEFDSHRLDPEPIENKRGGYKEISGTLGAIGSGGSRVDILCDTASRSGITVDILSSAGRFILFEAQNKMLFQAEDSDWQWSETEFPMLFASQMSAAFAELMTAGRCPLPTFEDMTEPHLALMRVFNSVFFGDDSLSRPTPVT